MHPSTYRASLALAAFLILLQRPGAAQSPCFPTTKAPPWVALDIGRVDYGASRPLPGARNAYELCSRSFGFGGLQDSLRYLFQSTRADFEMTVRLERVEPHGLGGVLAAWDGRTADEPYVAIAAHRLATGMLELRSSYRFEAGGKSSDGDLRPVPVELPIYLRVRRTGMVFLTEYSKDGKQFAEHLKLDGAGTALGEFFFTAGMVQASESREGASSALFTDPSIASRETSSPPILTSVAPPTSPLDGGVEVLLRGERLASAQKVTLAGVPARILEAGDGSVKVLAGAADAPVSGDVVLQTPDGSARIEQGFVYIGRAYIRGDYNEDGRPDISDAVAGLDYLFQGGRAPLCLEVADTNSDQKLDLSDEVYLLSHLFLGGPAPRDPYPSPGVGSTPDLPCGMPEAPVIRRILPIAFGEGELVTIEGKGFEYRDKERNIVQIGGSLAEVVDATSEKLVVRAGAILRAEAGVSVLIDFGQFVPILPTHCLTKDCILSLTGVINALHHIPLQLIPSDVHVLPPPKIDPDLGVMSVHVGRADWDPKSSYGVHASLRIPAVNGLSRGPRVVDFEYRNFYEGVTYGDWLAGLAQRMDEALGGVEFDVDADEKSGQVLLRSRRGLQLFLEPNDLIQSSIVIVILGWRGKCGPSSLDPIADARAFGWCRFEELIQPCGGYPKWEYFIPKQDVFQISDDIFPLPFPWELTTGQKRVLYNRAAYCHVRSKKLYKRCTLDDLVSMGRSEIPNFPQPAIVIKTGWTTHDSIVARGGDPDKYYKYTDEFGDTHYLELFHFTTKDVDQWFWATFWVPTPSDPGLPAFDCGPGGGADKPGTIPAPWSNYSMCVTTDEDSPCGNPNFAFAECDPTPGDRGCVSCHTGASYSGMKQDFLFSVSSGPQGTCP